MEKCYGRAALAFIHLFALMPFFIYCEGDTDVVCHESEKAALTKFRNGLIDPLNRLSSWDGPNCCKWRGIHCDNTTGYVVKLDLHNPYSMDEPSDVDKYGLWNLSGIVDHALLELKCLRYLDLSENTFDYIPIPDFLGSLKGLRYLNLSYAGFGGVVPWKIGNLSELQFLDLSSDLFALSVNNLQWVAKLSSLKHLVMKNVDLSMVNHDWLEVINNIPSLVELRLPFCSLTHLSPSLAFVNFSSLRVLDLQTNLFNSEFPIWIANLSSLVSLELNTCNLNGQIPSWLSQLHHLQVLNLATNNNLSADCSQLLRGNWMQIKIIDISSNQLYGEIPEDIGNLTSLVKLWLSENSLKGGIPKSIGNLCNLKSLNLCWNMIEKIPDKLEMEKCVIQTPFPKLTSLGLCENPIHGPMPEWFGQLKQLQMIDLENCSLTGPILESIGGFSSLNILNLAFNQLNGTFPLSFGQLSQLGVLDVASNLLTGVISESHFEKLSKLNILRMSSNSLVFNVSADWVPPFQLEVIDLYSCRLGPQFPSWLQTQNYTRDLDISNATISDDIPGWFWDFASHLEQANLSNNNMGGQLPSQLLMRPYATIDMNSNHFHGPIPLPINQVTLLDLSNNELSGPIPTNITNVMLIASFFSIFGNHINGTIPSTIGEMRSLVVLNMARNELRGSIPSSLGSCSSLEALDLSENQLFGIIPHSIGLLTQLRSLHLNNNSLSGELPLSLKNCSKLETLDLGENKFFREIPAWIGESFMYLRILRLRSNRFIGNIPTQISHLGLLQILDLAGNSLTGPIPSSFGNLTSMRNVHKKNRLVSYGAARDERREKIFFKERLFVSMKDSNFEYSTILSLVTSMDLSSNSLTGEIPEELASLSGLIVLNLSYNHLRGSIPREISNLRDLITFGVSDNQLTGAIPLSMISMTYLSDVNFSSNNFSGNIPTGNQFLTFEASAFSGNPYLCGPPILRECLGSVTEDDHNPTTTGDGTEIPWFYVSVGLGFGVGFSGLYLVLFLKRPWREALFRFEDRIIVKVLVVWNAVFP